MENNGDKSNINQSVPKKKVFKYSLYTFVLLLCIVQLCVSNIRNINKNINYRLKVKDLQQKREIELDKNKQLKSDIENFDSVATLESIARNNLKMAKEDEILVIIEEPKDIEVEEQNFIKKIFHSKKK